MGGANHVLSEVTCKAVAERSADMLGMLPTGTAQLPFPTCQCVQAAHTPWTEQSHAVQHETGNPQTHPFNLQKQVGCLLAFTAPAGPNFRCSPACSSMQRIALTICRGRGNQ